MATPSEVLSRLVGNVEKVIVGKRTAIELAVMALLCRGHLLIEDAPGLGKTMLARALARSAAIDFKRLQFTPDLLPSDVTGVAIYNPKTGEFEFKRGPVFTHVLLADEINRATPRTQSALLECMAESQVSVDGHTYVLPGVFMVIGTQNPIELAGTYPLPEAQLDRFFMRIELGYPSVEEEVSVMGMQMQEHPITGLRPVVSEAEIGALQQLVKRVQADVSVQRYIAEIVAATRVHADAALGASPRGSLALLRAAQAAALLRGQTFVDPALVKHVALPVLAHRIVPKPHAQLAHKTGAQIVKEVLASVAVPVAAA